MLHLSLLILLGGEALLLRLVVGERVGTGIGAWLGCVLPAAAVSCPLVWLREVHMVVAVQLAEVRLCGA